MRSRAQIVADFLVDWELEIRAGYTPAGELRDDLFERFGGTVRADEDLEIDDDPALQRELIDHTERLVEHERDAERGWDGGTTNDAITAAFDDLRGRGLVACECAGLSIQDGWAMAAVQRRDERGAVFFHQQDVVDALHGKTLLLAFGAFAGAPDAPELGVEIVDALDARGVASRWNGSPARRIELEPFAWRRRRWTASPRLARTARGGWWARLTGRRPRVSRAASAPAAAQRTLAEPYVWERTAQRTCRGFDAALAASVRGAWDAAGGERGQAGHDGPPHMLLPAGELARFVARDAFDNVCTEAEALQRTIEAAR